MYSAKFICVFSEDNLELLLVYIASGKIHSLQHYGAIARCQGGLPLANKLDFFEVAGLVYDVIL